MNTFFWCFNIHIVVRITVDSSLPFLVHCSHLIYPVRMIQAPSFFKVCQRERVYVESSHLWSTCWTWELGCCMCFKFNCFSILCKKSNRNTSLYLLVDYLCNKKKLIVSGFIKLCSTVWLEQIIGTLSRSILKKKLWVLEEDVQKFSFICEHQ